MSSTTEEAAGVGLEDFPTVPVDSIDPSPRNRRLSDDDPAIAELAESIRSTRLINPITVRPTGNGRFEIVCGERRWRAYRLLGKPDIPAVVRAMDDRQAQIERITENLQRQDLTFLEEGEGVAAFLEVCGNDFEEVAARIGYRENWVRRRARLPNLSSAWREEIAKPDTAYPHIRDSISRLEEIAMLPQDTQDAVLAGEIVRWTTGTAEMRKALARFFRNLDHKPWNREWEKKTISSGKRCDACKKRSDRDGCLFDDLHAANGDGGEKVKLCLDPACWDARVLAWCKSVKDDTPETMILWDGYQTQDAAAFCTDHFGDKPLWRHDWQERTAKEPVGDFSLPAAGIFVGGPRVGAVLDIWLRDERGDDAFDQGVKERRAEEKRAEDAERRMEMRRKELIEAAIPEDVFAFKAAARLDDGELAICLLNWGVWYGFSPMRYGPENDMDILSFKHAASPGLTFAWQQVRLEIIERMMDALDGDKTRPNDDRIVAMVTDALGVSLADIAAAASKPTPSA